MGFNLISVGVGGALWINDLFGHREAITETYTHWSSYGLLIPVAVQQLNVEIETMPGNSETLWTHDGN